LTFSVYPNPTKGILEIQAEENISSIEIFNLQGQILQKLELDGRSKVHKTDLGHINTGTYILKVTTATCVSGMRKFVRF